MPCLMRAREAGELYKCAYWSLTEAMAQGAQPLQVGG